MGSSCSVQLGSDSPTNGGCGRLSQRIGHCEEQCDSCDSDNAADLETTEHPLILRMQKEMDGSNTTPRTPRGPAPPWAAELPERRDRTATGCTPPRTPTAVKTVPPGLPEEEAQESAMALAGSFGPEFLQELFRQARQGDAGRMSVQLQKVHSAAFSLLGGSGIGFADGGHHSVVEQSEGAAELTADFLDKVRDSSDNSTLLGAATEGGVSVVHMLLQHKANPSVSDRKGQTPLHKAADHGSLLTSLMLLDRMQASDRSVLPPANGDGETPEMLAAIAGHGELCHALEVFKQMQADALSRQLGSALQAPDPSGHRISTGDALSLIELGHGSAHAAVLLRHSCIGSQMVPNLFQRIPDEQEELVAMVERVCNGLVTAESFLMSHAWDASDPGLDPSLRSFVTTAELRSQWQKIRQEALRGKGAQMELDDFWQTHLTAEAMASTMRNAVGDTFQLLLTALWLYTREAWLRHTLDALALALQHLPEAAMGATGSAPESAPLPTVPTAPQLVPLVEALAPCMQLVQSALSWFEEANIHHTAVTYRPLLLPMLGLQRLVDRYVAFRKSEASKDESRLDSAFWLSLGGGSFFSSLSSRNSAITRLAKTRCNVLLIIRPDEKIPSYPKHMSLRGSNVDDSLFPLESLFRISRITRTVSTELDVDGTCGLTNSRWPVIIIEVYSVSCFSEAMETLHLQRQLRPNELLTKVEEWVASSPLEHEAERYYLAGLLLAKASRSSHTSKAAKLPPEQQVFLEKARKLLGQSFEVSRSAGDLDLATQALLSKVQIPGGSSGAEGAEGRKAFDLLKTHFGEGRGFSQRTKELVKELAEELGESCPRWADR